LVQAFIGLIIQVLLLRAFFTVFRKLALVFLTTILFPEFTDPFCLCLLFILIGVLLEVEFVVPFQEVFGVVIISVSRSAFDAIFIFLTLLVTSFFSL
jgi:hypothetical protein